MTRMSVSEFKAYLMDALKEAQDREYLEEIGKAFLGSGVRYVPIADGYEIDDDSEII